MGRCDINLDEIRVAVRTQLDLDDTDLPDVLLNLYVQEGYDRIIGMESRWPFFATTWDVFVPSGLGYGTTPVDARAIESVFGPSGTLGHVDLRFIQDTYGLAGSASSSAVWSQMHDRLYIAPSIGADTTYTVGGFRGPIDWIAAGASSPVDADPRLHIPIVWYCCSLGYAQQEDEVLEATYLNRFRESTDLAIRSVMRPWTGAPKILNGLTRVRTYPAVQIVVPGSTP